MASPVDIANAALANIGATNLVSSIDPPDGSVEAGYCATFYPLARARMLEAVKPAFAVKRASPALNATNGSAVWAYSYALPSDCLKPVRVLASTAAQLFDDSGTITTATPPLGQELGSADFQVERQTLYTNEPDAVLLYVFDEADTTRWTPLFTESVEARLSSFLAGPLIKGREGADIGMSWRQTAFQLASAAAASLANATNELAEHVPASLRARA